MSENIIASGAVALLVLAAGLAWNLLDESVPVWLVPLAAGIGMGPGFLLGRSRRGKDELLGYQGELLGEALLTLNELIAGTLEHRGISHEKFVENGILGAGIQGLTLRPREKVRMAVLEWDADDDLFRMLFQNGYKLTRKTEFSLPRASMAGHALESGQLEWCDDVTEDDRWEPHPKASPNHAYHSLAVAPVKVADEIVALLSVVSSEKAAFSKGDLTFIELLAAFLGIAWRAIPDADGSASVSTSHHSVRITEREGGK